MTLKNNRTLLPCYFKLCASFCCFGEFKLELQSGNAQFGQIRRILELCDLEILRMTFKNNRAPLLCYFELCASFRSHWWIQAGVTVRKCPILVKFDDFLSRVTLKFDGWHWKTIGHLLSNINLYTSFHHHLWIQIGVTVRKRLNWVVTSVTLTFRPLTLTFCMDITSVIGNKSRKFHDDTMMGR